jgi:hypothetical protein
LGETTTSEVGVGVKGEAPDGSTAVWGHNSGGANSTAGWFDGRVYSNGSVLTSDARLKKDVRDLSYGLAEILRLRPVLFKWKTGGDSDHVGLIAQEVEKVIPEVAANVRSPSGQDVMTVDYVELVPMLIKGVQEQNKIIAQQQTRIAALEQGRAPAKLSSMFYGAATFGLFPLGIVLGRLRQRRVISRIAPCDGAKRARSRAATGRGPRRHRYRRATTA